MGSKTATRRIFFARIGFRVAAWTPPETICCPPLTKRLVDRQTEQWESGLKPAMPPKRSITLTEAELRLMKLLWARGESAVADLVSAVADETPLAYTSVLTTVRILERKGYVQHRQEGRAFLYSPCVAEHEAGRSEVQHLLQRFFGNSRERLLISLLGDHEVTAEELDRLKRAIAAAPDEDASETDRREDAAEEA